MTGFVQADLFPEEREYKVRWLAFEKVYEKMPTYPYADLFAGFNKEKTRYWTTAGLMTKMEAESFAEFVKEGCYEYAGEVEILNVITKNTISCSTRNPQ